MCDVIGYKCTYYMDVPEYMWLVVKDVMCDLIGYKFMY